MATTKSQPLLFIHTKKAVNQDHPGDRVFLVTDSFKDGRLTYYNAWKCTLTKDGLEHPAFDKPIKFKELHRGAIFGRNGSTPTACFRKDSFYQQVTAAELEVLAQKAEPSAGIKRKPLLKNGSVQHYVAGKFKESLEIQIFLKMSAPVTEEFRNSLIEKLADVLSGVDAVPDVATKLSYHALKG